MVIYIFGGLIFSGLTYMFYKLDKTNRAALCGIITIMIVCNLISDYDLIESNSIKSILSFVSDK